MACIQRYSMSTIVGTTASHRTANGNSPAAVHAAVPLARQPRSSGPVPTGSDKASAGPLTICQVATARTRPFPQTLSVPASTLPAPADTPAPAGEADAADATIRTPTPMPAVAAASGPLPSPLQSTLMLSAAPPSLQQLLNVYTWLLRPVVSGLMEVGVATQVMGLPLELDALTVAAAACYLIFTYDRLKDAQGDADRLNNGSRAAFFHRHAPAINSSLALVGGMGLDACAHLPPAAQAVVAGTFAVGMLYATPVLPGGYSFRTLPGCKLPFCVATWTLGTTLMPILAAAGAQQQAAGGAGSLDEALLLHAGMMWAYAAITSFCFNVFTDLRDVDGDRLAGTRTIPVLLGEVGCKALVAGLCAANAGLALGLGTPALLVAPAAFGAMLVPGAQQGRAGAGNKVVENMLCAVEPLMLLALLAAGN